MSKLSGLTSKRQPSAAPTYEADFYSWALRQARLVREGRLAEADLANIAEELADLGRSEYREMRSALARTLQHMLKWDYQPAKRSEYRAHEGDSGKYLAAAGGHDHRAAKRGAEEKLNRQFGV